MVKYRAIIAGQHFKVEVIDFEDHMVKVNDTWYDINQLDRLEISVGMKDTNHDELFSGDKILVKSRYHSSGEQVDEYEGLILPFEDGEFRVKVIKCIDMYAAFTHTNIRSLSVQSEITIIKDK